MLGANATTAETELWRVVQFEQSLANISIDEGDRHDTGQWYTKLTVGDLSSQVPDFDWTTYFEALMPPPGFNSSEEVVSYAMPYLVEVAKLIKSVDPQIVYDYLVWRVVMDIMPFLPPRFQAPRAEFRRVLLGVLADRNRWNKCVEWTNKKMGMAVGSLFVKNHFNHASKLVALEMIQGIRVAFNELLEENHWMDDATRQVAKDKANSMNERIGYPDYIVNATALNIEYDHMKLSPENFLANMFTRDLNTMSCFLLAVSMYYFYLSAFFWMLNIAFDVARTLKQATTELRLTSGAQWCRFCCYLANGWLTPALLVAVAVLLDLLHIPEVPRQYTPQFGGSAIGICWFGSRTALVIYFVVPFTVVLTLNLLFFIYSSCLVWETTHSSAKITTSGPKTSFRLYLRLATLMGLSWAAGLLAGSLDVEPVW